MRYKLPLFKTQFSWAAEKYIIIINEWTEQWTRERKRVKKKHWQKVNEMQCAMKESGEEKTNKIWARRNSIVSSIQGAYKKKIIGCQVITIEYETQQMYEDHTDCSPRSSMASSEVISNWISDLASSTIDRDKMKLAQSWSSTENQVEKTKWRRKWFVLFVVHFSCDFVYISILTSKNENFIWAFLFLWKKREKNWLFTFHLYAITLFLSSQL